MIRQPIPNRKSNLILLSLSQSVLYPNLIPSQCQLMTISIWPLADTNYCELDSCLHGGVCQTVLGGHECECLEGYEGDRCEIGKQTIILF